MFSQRSAFAGKGHAIRERTFWLVNINLINRSVKALLHSTVVILADMVHGNLSYTG